MPLECPVTHRAALDLSMGGAIRSRVPRGSYGGWWDVVEHVWFRGWIWADNGRLLAIMRVIGVVLGCIGAVLGRLASHGLAVLCALLRIVAGISCRVSWLVSAIVGWC